jgi:hypothetical protein
VKKFVLGFLALIALGMALILPATADDEVSATVTPLVLAVNVSPTSTDYGALALSPADNSRVQGVSDLIMATNTGSVTSDFMIRGSDALPTVGTDTTWTINCSPAVRGTVGANQFVHRFQVAPLDDVNAQALCSALDKTLFSDVAPLGQIPFELQMNMPTTTTGFSERTTTVTVIAVESVP